MENKMLFEVETSWPFPILQYTINTSYTEVRKASGISYILLQLISSSDNNSEKIIATLKGIGVPNDIHYIFADELAYMISQEIIQMRSGREFDVELMERYQISDFKITERGKNLFKEGTIPICKDKLKKLNVYYDVSKKDTQIKFVWKLFRLENSTLDKNCVGDVILNNADIEMFIKDNMNKYAFKKGESISKFEHETLETFVYKMENAVTLKISNDGISIQAKDKDRDAFIHKVYSADIITRIIDAKKKYHFPEFIATEVKEYDFNTLTGITKMCMPSQISAITNIKSPLSLDGKCEIRGSEYSLDGTGSLELMRKCDISGVACYFENGKLYSIIPGRFLMKVNGYPGKCAINLIAIQELSEDVQQQLMREVFLYCINAPDHLKKCNIIKKLTQISNCKDYLEQFTNSLVHKTELLTEKINIFMKLNNEFVKESCWNEYSKKYAERLFEMLCAQITVDGFVAQNILGKKLNKIMGLNDIEYISKISKNLVDKEGDVIAFEILEGADFNIDVILSAINIFVSYCKQIIDGVHVSGNSKLSVQCTLLGQALLDLKKLTGIEDPSKDSAKLDFDQEQFIQVMATFTDSMKKIEKYKVFAIEEYKLLLFFQERFVEIKEVVTIEEEATKNPKNINKNYIEQMLKKSRYKVAICDLHVRLQYELNRLFNTNNVPTFGLLSNHDMKNYLNKHEIHDMNALIKCRNGFQYPKDKREVQYSEMTIRKWCTIVEKLGGMNNELRSKN